MPEYLTTAEVCERWQIERKTLYKLLGSCRLRYIAVTGHAHRVLREDVERFEREQLERQRGVSLSSATP